MAPLDYLKSPPFSPAEEFQLNFWRRWLALRPPLNMRALAKVVESDGHSCLNQWASGRGINNFVGGELALRELLLRTEVCEDRHSPGG